MSTSQNTAPQTNTSQLNTSRPFTSRRRSALLAGALLAGLVSFAMVGSSSNGASAQSSATTETPTPPRSVIINGVGRVSATPDRLFLTLGVETQAPRIADALKANNIAAQNLVKTLRDKGVAEKDIKTSQLSIYPQFDNSGRRIKAYSVNNSVTATIRNIATSGDIIDAAASVTGDAIRINGLEFSVGDPTVPLATARDLAVKDARTQAEQLVKSAGVKLGKLRTIRASSDISQAQVFSPTASDSSARTVSAPVSAGSQEISASVELVYDIQD